LSDDESTLELKSLKTKVTPLPKAQFGVLCAVRIAEPIAFSQIFPYINEFMDDLHLTDDPKRIGLYSGLVESIFAAFQLTAIYNMAKLSDKIGRRPVILCGIAGMAITSTLFGLSKSLTMMLIVRALAGLCSGNTAVIHAVVGELTDPSNEAVALPIYGLIWPFGSIIGPLLGGSLSNPATKFPNLLGYDFLRNYPYFLPCFMSGLLSIIAVMFGYFFLEETSPAKRRPRVEKTASSNTSSSSLTLYGTMDSREDLPELSESFTMRSLLSRPGIRALCGSGFALSFVVGGFDVIFVLYCYSAIKDGGLALPVSQIGYALSGSGMLSIFIQLFFMPHLLRNVDKAKLYNFCMAMFPCAFIVLSTLNFIARTGFDEASGTVNPHASGLVWIGIALVLTMVRIGNLSYSISMILTKEYSPNPASLGTSNGLVQFSMCLGRAISPAFTSSVYALSVDHNWLGGYFWVLIVVTIAIGGVYQSTMIARAGRQSAT